MSPGEQILDLTHVDDIAAAFIVVAERLLACDDAIFEDYLLSGERHSVRELVPIIEAGIGRTIAANFGARAYRAREMMVPIEAAPGRRLPGWVAKRRLCDSLASMNRMSN